MRRLFLLLAVFAAVLMPFAAHAQTVDTRGLTESQVAELNSQAAQIRDGAQTPQAQAEKISTYVEIGKGIGAGIGSAAKELNVAVNDFAKTPVGQVTMALIVWKVAGAKIIGIIIGLLWCIFGFATWLYAFNKVCFPKDIHEEFDKETGKRLSRRVVQSDLDSDSLVGYRFFFAVFFFAILGIACMMFFAGGW